MNEVGIGPQKSPQEEKPKKRLLFYPILILLTAIFLSAVSSFGQLACAIKNNYLAYGFEAEESAVNFCKIVFLAGPAALIIIFFLNWRIFKKHGRRELILKGILPSFIIIAFFGSTLFSPYLEPLIYNYTEKKLRKIAKNITVIPNRVCYLESKDPNWSGGEVLRWEGSIRFPKQSAAIDSNFGRFSSSHLISVGGLSTTGRMFIDNNFTWKIFDWDSKFHQIRLDFPVRPGGVEYLDKPPESFLGFVIYASSGNVKAPFYHYELSGKLKTILEGKESSYWLPYCIDISPESITR